MKKRSKITFEDVAYLFAAVVIITAIAMLSSACSKSKDPNPKGYTTIYGKWEFGSSNLYGDFEITQNIPRPFMQGGYSVGGLTYPVDGMYWADSVLTFGPGTDHYLYLYHPIVSNDFTTITTSKLEYISNTGTNSNPVYTVTSNDATITIKRKKDG